MLDEQSQLVDLGQIATKITDGTHHTPNYTNDGVIFLSASKLRCDVIVGLPQICVASVDF